MLADDTKENINFARTEDCATRTGDVSRPRFAGLSPQVCVRHPKRPDDHYHIINRALRAGRQQRTTFAMICFFSAVRRAAAFVGELAYIACVFHDECFAGACCFFFLSRMLVVCPARARFIASHRTHNF